MEIYFIDTETGGLDPLKTDLLTVGIVEWKDKIITRTKELKIARDVYRVTPKAMAINKIDLKYFNTSGFGYYTPYEAMKAFIEFIGGNNIHGQKKVVAGHNVAFDIGFINEQLFKANHNNINDYIDCHTIDTAAILKALHAAGKVPEDISRLSKALDYFRIYVGEGERHTALGDAILTAKLFNKLLDVIS